MYLIDTSVWIDYFREKENSAVKIFNSILDQKLPFGLTSIIYQEILQGASTQKDFETLSAYLKTQRFFNPKDNIISYQAAAEIYFNCRKKGITIRSTIDCLIAQIAMEHDLTVVHNDADYIHISSLHQQLKLAV